MTTILHKTTQIYTIFTGFATKMTQNRHNYTQFGHSGRLSTHISHKFTQYSHKTIQIHTNPHKYTQFSHIFHKNTHIYIYYIYIYLSIQTKRIQCSTNPTNHSMVFINQSINEKKFYSSQIF